MHLSKDLREFVESLNARDVEYLVVGAHAVSWHGHPRFTADIDFICPRNQKRTLTQSYRRWMVLVSVRLG